MSHTIDNHLTCLCSFCFSCPGCSLCPHSTTLRGVYQISTNVEWPLTINKIKTPKQTNKRRETVLGKVRGIISKIFRLCFWQLGLNKEIGTMAVFVVTALSTFRSQWSLTRQGLTGKSWSYVPVSANGGQVVLWVARAEEAWASLPVAWGEMIYCLVPFTKGLLWAGAVLDVLWASCSLSSLQVHEVKGGAWIYSWGNKCFRELKSRVGTWLSTVSTGRGFGLTHLPFKCPSFCSQIFPDPQLDLRALCKGHWPVCSE